MTKRDLVFGEIQGYPEGSVFRDRSEIMRAGLHHHNVQGISGHPDQGANAITISGGYQDSFDEHHLEYIGEGKNADQKLENRNLAMYKSFQTRIPIRVIRGGKKIRIPGLPPGHYRYEGLYEISAFRQERGEDGFIKYVFTLKKLL